MTGAPSTPGGDRPAGGLGAGRSLDLIRHLDRLWAILADDYGLLPELAIDAVLARAGRGERVAATPRLLELVFAHELTVDQAAEALSQIGSHPWRGAERRAVEATLDAWWAETLERLPGEHPQHYRPEVVLGLLVSYPAPLVRWLDPWLQRLDGPGASHLATLIIGGPDGLAGPAWVGKEDQARQVLGWTRTETVINGLVLVGGVHLDAEVLSDAMDRLI